MEELKKRYDTVSERLWNLETRMDKMSKEQAESSGAIQSKLDVLLRNSITQDKLEAEKPSGTRVDFVEPQRKKRESTPLPRIDSTMASGATRTAMKGGASNSTRTSEDSRTHAGLPPDAMTWASIWYMMKNRFEVFATRNTVRQWQIQENLPKTQEIQGRFRRLHLHLGLER